SAEPASVSVQQYKIQISKLYLQPVEIPSHFQMDLRQLAWRRHWDRLSNYFKYPKEIRKIIYTTNIIEGFHRQLRSVTKSKGAFTSEEALMKLLFLVQEAICSKWNRPAHNWNQTLSQLAILFGDRLKLGI